MARRRRTAGPSWEARGPGGTRASRFLAVRGALLPPTGRAVSLVHYSVREARILCMQLQHPFRALAPTVDADVLGVLAAAHAAFTVPQMARMISTRSTAGIRLAVDRLLAQGVVSEQRIGRTSAFSLNDDHVLAPPLRQIANARHAVIERLRTAVAGWHAPPELGAVFGSAARGEMRADSDLDLLLVRPRDVADGEWLRNSTELTLLASGLTGNDARIVDLTVDDLAAPEYQALLEDVRSDGIVFFGDARALAASPGARA
jgi:predicted nucleotidyltransferase